MAPFFVLYSGRAPTGMPVFDVGSGVGGQGCDRVNEAAPPAADALRLQPCSCFLFFYFFVLQIQIKI